MPQVADTKPWDAPFPAVSYSESQERRRRQCARAHYHAVYTAHGGWAAPAQTDSWRAYRAKKGTPLSAAVGTAVHEAATACVEALRARKPLPPFHELRATAGASLNTRWRNSRDRREEFMRAPSRVPLFLEALYGDAPRKSDLHRAAQNLDRALLGLLQCDDVWNLVRSAQSADVIIMDPFASVAINSPLGPVTCYGAADLLVRPTPNDKWYIIDFKTGGADGVVDQILTYALIARDALQLQVTDGCMGIIVSLGERPGEAVAPFAITPEDLADAELRLLENATAVRALVADQVTGEPMSIDAFPMTDRPRTCGWCAYRVLCHPEQVQPGAVIAQPAATAGV